MKKIKILFSIFCLSAFLSILPIKKVKADMFGGDLVFLAQILIQAIEQVSLLTQIIGTAQDTVSILEEMNRGIQEVLRLSETAHIPLPPFVFEKAKEIKTATEEAKRIYGDISNKAPLFTRIHFESGKEALFLSQDAFEYSSLLDEQANRIKSSAITASQSAATKLSAQALGVILHAVSHSNRIEAKQLEILSSQRLKEAALTDAKVNLYNEAHHSIEKEMKKAPFSGLNSFLGDGK